IAIRRHLNRPAIEALVQQAYRVAEEQTRTVEVLRWLGPPAAEVAIDLLRASEAIGPRAFLLEAAGSTPESFPLALPLVHSTHGHEARLGAELLGRRGRAEGVPHLLNRVNDPDPRVRHAVIDALGRFREKGVAEALRSALVHGSPDTRGRAAHALAQRKSGAVAMPLLKALEDEKDPHAFRDMADALAHVGSPA